MTLIDRLPDTLSEIHQHRLMELSLVLHASLLKIIMFVGTHDLRVIKPSLVTAILADFEYH